MIPDLFTEKIGFGSYLSYNSKILQCFLQKTFAMIKSSPRTFYNFKKALIPVSILCVIFLVLLYKMPRMKDLQKRQIGPTKYVTCYQASPENDSIPELKREYISYNVHV